MKKSKQAEKEKRKEWWKHGVQSGQRLLNWCDAEAKRNIGNHNQGEKRYDVHFYTLFCSILSRRD